MAHEESEEKHKAAQEKSRAEVKASGQKYVDEEGIDLTLSGDDAIASGQMVGLNRAKQLYGMGLGGIGAATTDITARRKAAMDGKDPASTSLRQGRNRQLRMAKAKGASDQEMAQIGRSAEMDIGTQEFKTQNKALDKYQKLIGNIIGCTQGLEMGFAQLQKSGDMGDFEEYSDGVFGSVVCTELHRQGYLDRETYEKDVKYGQDIMVSNPSVYYGYRLLANPIVRLMVASSMFTALISVPTELWAFNMAGKKNLIGSFINKLGEPICSFVWKLKLGVDYVKDYKNKAKSWYAKILPTAWI